MSLKAKIAELKADLARRHEASEAAAKSLDEARVARSAAFRAIVDLPAGSGTAEYAAANERFTAADLAQDTAEGMLSSCHAEELIAARVLIQVMEIALEDVP